MDQRSEGADVGWCGTVEAIVESRRRSRLCFAFRACVWMYSGRLIMGEGGGDGVVLVHVCMWFDVGHQMAVFCPISVILGRSSFFLYASLLAGLMDRSVLRLLEGLKMMGS